MAMAIKGIRFILDILFKEIFFLLIWIRIPTT